MLVGRGLEQGHLQHELSPLALGCLWVPVCMAASANACCTAAACGFWRGRLITAGSCGVSSSACGRHTQIPAQELTVKFLVSVTHIRLMLTLSSSPLNRTMIRYSRSCRQARCTCSAGCQQSGVCSIEACNAATAAAGGRVSQGQQAVTFQ